MVGKKLKYTLAMLGLLTSLVIPQDGLVRSQTFSAVRGSDIPDFAQLSFAQFPASPFGGASPQVAPSVLQRLGYDPSRSWSAGTPIADVLTLGDFQRSFQLEQFQLDQIFGITGLNPAQLSLADAGFLQQQSIASVVTAIGLEQFSPSQIVPLGDLLNAGGFGSLGNYNFGELLRNPQTAQVLQTLQLGQIDLSQYGLSNSIPGLTSTQLAQFQGWQNFAISQVPTLQNVPFGQFPNPLKSLNVVPMARVDVVLGHLDAYGTNADSVNVPGTEANRRNVVSGAYLKGYPPLVVYECNQPSCAHIELTDLQGSQPFGSLQGKQWIVGPEQPVPGGVGSRCSGLLGDKEPTGRHPIGPPFKLVVEQTSEAEGRADLALYFRFDCSNPISGPDMTPYAFGPFYVGQAYEEGEIVLGL